MYANQINRVRSESRLQERLFWGRHKSLDGLPGKIFECNTEARTATTHEFSSGPLVFACPPSTASSLFCLSPFFCVVSGRFQINTWSLMGGRSQHDILWRIESLGMIGAQSQCKPWYVMRPACNLEWIIAAVLKLFDLRTPLHSWNLWWLPKYLHLRDLHIYWYFPS